MGRSEKKKPGHTYKDSRRVVHVIYALPTKWFVGHLRISFPSLHTDLRYTTKKNLKTARCRQARGTRVIALMARWACETHHATWFWLSCMLVLAVLADVEWDEAEGLAVESNDFITSVLFWMVFWRLWPYGKCRCEGGKGGQWASHSWQPERRALRLHCRGA